MKGFPNQVADLGKLSAGMRCILELVGARQRVKNDAIYGESLVRAGVAGTGHSPRPVEEYLAEQRLKTPENQSYRTTARGLRELYRLLGFIDDRGTDVVVTWLGRQAAIFAGAPMDAAQIAFWRRAIRNMIQVDDDGEVSHPYQVLLRLIARKPGIAKPLCALALEANDDSPEELDRVIALANQSEHDIITSIGVSKTNWDNAVKVLPRFAEQLQDVVVGGTSRNRTYAIADAPGHGDEPPSPPETALTTPAVGTAAPPPRHPRSSRAVSPMTIGMAGIADRDEPPVPPELDPEAAAEAIRIRRDRLRRHNLLVRSLATRFAAAGMTLFEDPFDILAIHRRVGFLVEVKSLNGNPDDERDRLQESLGQLLYYESFVTEPVAGRTAVHKIAFFESRITPEHQEFLNDLSIATAWMNEGRIEGDGLAASVLGPYLEELR